MLPVWNQTDAPCSSGPALIGSTFREIAASDPDGILPSDQVRTAPSTLSAWGWLDTYFRPAGSSSRMRTSSASEVPVLRTRMRTVAGTCRFMFGGDWTSTVTATTCLPAGSGPAPAPASPGIAEGPSVRASSGSAGGLDARPAPVAAPAGSAGSSGGTGLNGGAPVLDSGDVRPGGFASWTSSRARAFAAGRALGGADFAASSAGIRSSVAGRSSGFGSGEAPDDAGPRHRAMAARSRPGRAPSGASAPPAAISPGSARIAGPWIGPLLGNGPGDSASVEPDRLLDARPRQAHASPPPRGPRNPRRGAGRVHRHIGG